MGAVIGHPSDPMWSGAVLIERSMGVDTDSWPYRVSRAQRLSSRLPGHSLTPVASGCVV